MEPIDHNFSIETEPFITLDNLKQLSNVFSYWLSNNDESDIFKVEPWLSFCFPYTVLNLGIGIKYGSPSNCGK